MDWFEEGFLLVRPAGPGCTQKRPPLRARPQRRQVPVFQPSVPRYALTQNAGCRPFPAYNSATTMSAVSGLAALTVFWRLLLTLALVGTLSSAIFLILGLIAAVRYRLRSRRERQLIARTPMAALPPVTILKPVHGAEPRLRENLESFFLQDYPDFEIVFGARDAR